MNVLNFIDWIAIIFFGGSTLLLTLTAIIIYAAIHGKKKDSFY